MRQRIRAFFLTSGLAIGLVAGAHANPVPTMSLEVFEGMPGSLVSVAGPTPPTSSGSLQFTSATIPNFSLVQASVAGFPIVPQADLSAGSIQMTTAGFTGTRELKILITQDNLDTIGNPINFQTSTAANFIAGANQILGVTLSAYLDTTNVDFGQGTLIQSDMYTSAGTSGTINHALPFVNGPFSETFVIDALFSGNEAATLFPSIILNTTSIPEPGTLTLLGTALVGLNMIRRRRQTVA